MSKQIGEKTTAVIDDAVALHEAIFQKLRAAQGRSDQGNVPIELRGPMVEAAATLTAAIMAHQQKAGYSIDA